MNCAMNNPVLYESAIKNIQLGQNVKIIQPVNMYGCKIGDNCFIGPFVEIQKNVKIGKNCKIQSHTFICELVTIGKNTFVSHGVMFVNDFFSKGSPAMGDKNIWGKTIVGKNVSIGSNATILPVSICDDVVIGAGSVVTKNIIVPGIYAGNPASLIRKLTINESRKVKFLDLKKQYILIQKEIDKAIAHVISNANFINGQQVAQFENEFASYQQVKYCIGVGNGTDALEIAIEALDLPKESEILVPANTFIASAEAVTRTGHKVVFCDCEPDNYTISVKSIREKISAKTAAILAVHLYGHPCDMDEILSLADDNNLKIIEDCAQAHGAEYKHQRVGGIGHIGTFSFFPGKNLGAYGDAGAIVTNDPILEKKCRMIANHGRLEKYEHQFEGRNSRLDTLQAAILSVKLKYLDGWTKTRIEVASYYFEKLKKCHGVVLPVCEPWAKHVYHLFVIQIENRNGLLDFLKSKDIEVSVHYPIALPKLEAYHYLEQFDEPFQAFNMGEKLLSLPIGEHMDLHKVNIVTSAIKEYLEEIHKC